MGKLHEILRPSSKGIFYWKSLALAVLLTCLPITIISAAYLYMGNQQLVKQFQEKNDSEMIEAAKQIDKQLGQLINYALHMVVKPHFKPTISDMDFAQQFEETNQLLDTLTLIENADPIIDQVYLYVAKQNKVLQPSIGLRTLEQEEESSRWKELMSAEQGIFWTHELQRPFSRGSSHAVVMKLPFNGNASYGAIVIYINPSKLFVFANPDRYAYLLDEEGHIIGQSGASRQNPEAFAAIQSHQTQHTEALNQPSGSSKVPLDQDTLLMNTVTLEKMGGKWTYLSATPQSIITAPTRPYTHILIVCWIFAVLAALALSWFASHRMYRPIRRMMNLLAGWRSPDTDVHNELDYIEREWQHYRITNETLERRLNQAVPSMREAIMNQFITGQAAHWTEREMIEKLHTMGVAIEGRSFAAIVLQLHTTDEEYKPLSDKDDVLLTYAAINIVAELSQSAVEHVHTINFLDGSFGLVLILPTQDHTQAEAHQELHSLCSHYINVLHEVLRIQATIVYNGPTSSWMDIPHAMEQAQRALRCRTFDATSQLLQADQVLDRANTLLEAPLLVLEQELIYALNMGLAQEATQALEQYVEALQASHAAEWLVHQALLRLMGSIHRAMLQAGHNPYAVYDSAQLYEELRMLRNPQASLSWFQEKVIHPYIHSLSRSFNASMKEIVDNLLERIAQSNGQEIALETYANSNGVSISQLSKAFKQMTGTNYVDYVTSIRMNYCKQLLLTTDMKINEIAESAGYQAPYFNRMFKKLEGITPGQYRQRHSSQTL